MENVIFVSEIQDPYIKGSSTQIMTKNLLIGMRENQLKVHFICIVDKDCNKENVNSFFEAYVDKIDILESKMNLTLNKGKYKQLLINFLGLAKIKNYEKMLEKIQIKKDALLISHTPSIEAVYLCKEIKRKNLSMRYIQYWSDPLAISAMNIENFSYKRYPIYLLEKKLLSLSDEIVYGTKPLMEFQKTLFKAQSKKIRYIDVSYSEELPIESKEPSNLVFGYTGGYRSNIRNIIPLYNVFKGRKDVNLVIYGTSDVSLESKENIEINQRCSQNDIRYVEANLDVLVCLLNHKGIQIPGKTFYQTNSKKIILVVLDGRYQKKIYEYLNQFKRFEFCSNNEDSISLAIERIRQGRVKVDLSKIEMLSPKKIICDLINK